MVVDLLCILPKLACNYFIIRLDTHCSLTYLSP